ncbi:MAG: insulinase family protein, partial [Candidatus Omnitrophica bacterium]|nr:insulinase family protein [Candidatus Omnitrophota bacterium]
EPTFPEQEFEVEKEILRSEIREDLDSPYTAAFRLFQKTIFAGRPYAHSAQGTEETLAGIHLSEARDYYRRRFSSAPLTLGLVGNVDPDRALAGLSRLVEDLPDGEPFETRNPGPPADTAKGVAVHEPRATEAECLIQGFHAPGFRDPDYATWKVLDSITGGSMDSRLFAEIREKLGLVYQIGSSYPALEWSSFFAISLISTRQNHDRILGQLEVEIRKLREVLPEEEELARAKTYLKGTFLMSQERNADQAHLLARYHSLGLGIDFIDRYPRMLDAVTVERVREVAEQSLHSPVIAVVGP